MNGTAFRRCAFVACLYFMPVVGWSACTPSSDTVDVEVDSAQVIRRNAPKAIFGFNVPWRDFQIGYVDAGGDVRPELIDFLRPFQGASYRYPGGSPSNWFDWRNANKGRNERASQVADFKRQAPLVFGPAEFASFVRRVDGVALVTLNVAGTTPGQYDDDEASKQVSSAIDTISGAGAFGCVGGGGCRVVGLEFGNEMDWPPYHWTASEYARRVQRLLPLLKKKATAARLVVHGRTAPWDVNPMELKRYNSEIGESLSQQASGFAVHPYYDGIPVPDALRIIDSYATAWRSAAATGEIYVTEHARWPAVPKTGKWQQNWFMATGVGGAISTADFQLGLIVKPTVAMANWHALGTDGPWQLIRLDRQSRDLYPTPVYLALKTLRQAFQDDVYALNINDHNKGAYAGGYRLRIVAMGDSKSGYRSILGVNRGSRPIAVNIHDKAGRPFLAKQFIRREVSATDPSADNTDSQKRNVIQEENLVTDSEGFLCVNENSVFSFIEVK